MRDEILIEKRKWDGSVAGREQAKLLASYPDTFVWVIEPGRCGFANGRAGTELAENESTLSVERTFGRARELNAIVGWKPIS